MPTDKRSIAPHSFTASGTGQTLHCIHCGLLESATVHLGAVRRVSADVVGSRNVATALDTALTRAEKAESQLEEMRKAFAELIGADVDKWPDHGNAPLAMTAAFALAQKRAEDAAHAQATMTSAFRSSSAAIESLPAGELLKPDLYYYEWDHSPIGFNRSFRVDARSGRPNRIFKIIAVQEQK